MNNLIELKTININSTDTTVALLNDCTEVRAGDDVAMIHRQTDRQLYNITIVSMNAYDCVCV